MTIPSTPRKAGPYQGNGVQTAWPFSFKVFASSDVRVTVSNNDQVESTLVEGRDYTVTLNANQDTSPGGVVTYPLASGNKLTVVGSLPFDQPLGLPSGGNFSPLALENELDRTIMQVQQVREELSRAMVLPVTSSASAELPAPEADKYLGWNADATALVNLEAPTGGGGTGAYADQRFETFTGTGSAVAFSLAVPPIDLASTVVSVDGILLVPGADYDLSGSMVVFAVAPTNGSEILVRYGHAVAAPPQDREVYRFVATSGQTVFTLAGGYANGTNALAVYVNGLRMESGGIDYTENSGTTITFVVPLAEGDSVVCLVGTEPTGGNTGGGSTTVAWTDVTGKPSTFAPSAHTHVIADVTGLQSALDAKQATLVSATNIKTINGTSLLGSGDLVISGGGSSGVASFNTRTGAVALTSADVVSALQTGANAAEVSISTTAASSTSNSFHITRTASYNGGAPGWVNSALFVDTNVSAGATSFEWGVTSRVANYAAAGENVGMYGQGNKYSTGPTWGGVFEACDLTNAATGASTGGVVGLEVDVFGNGADDYERRIGIDVVVGNAQLIRNGVQGIGRCLAYDGVRIGAQGNNNAVGAFSYGLNILSAEQAGIINQATGVRGIYHKGTYQVGIDLSQSTNTDSAIRIKAGDWIALDAFNAIKLRYNSGNGYIEFYNNGTRHGYIDMTGGSDSDLASGGSSAQQTSVVTDIAGTYTLSNTVGSIKIIDDGSYNTGGYHTANGEMETWFDMVSNGYFANNPSGHAAVITRCQTEVLATSLRGQGMIFGNVAGNQSGGVLHSPTSQIESWFNGSALGNYLPPSSDGYTNKPLADGVTYRVCITSKVSNARTYIRYRLYRKDTSSYGTTTYQLERDTGDVYDQTPYAERNHTGLAILHVFANTSAPAWTLTFSNVQIVWRPESQAISELPSWLYSGNAMTTDTAQTVTGIKTFSNGLNTFAVAVTGATRAIGQAIASYTYMSAWGGTYAKSFTDGTVLNIDSICTPGTITGFMSPTPTNGEVENVVRPLWSIVSTLVKELIDKKVI